MGKWLVGAGIVLVLLAFAMFVALPDVSVDRVRITGIENVGQGSFTLMGEITIRNDGRFAVDISGVPYTVTLRETGDVLAQGELAAFTLPAHAQTTVPFTASISYKGSATAIAALLLKERVDADLAGTANVALPGGLSYGVPFTQAIDLKAQLRQMAALGGGALGGVA
jgi:LEA14-like dessication related protein